MFSTLCMLYCRCTALVLEILIDTLQSLANRFSSERFLRSLLFHHRHRCPQHQCLLYQLDQQTRRMQAGSHQPKGCVPSLDTCGEVCPSMVDFKKNQVLRVNTFAQRVFNDYSVLRRDTRLRTCKHREKLYQYMYFNKKLWLLKLILLFLSFVRVLPLS